MLFNISNHPSAKWPEEQMSEAVNQWGAVTDIPFPQIDPNASAERVKALAEERCEEFVRVIEGAGEGSAFHIMGEHNFTFHIVTKLKARGYRVYASTTTRDDTVERGNQKISIFTFHRFREY